MALLQLSNYLNKKSVYYSGFESLDTADFHPILKGRLFSVKLLSGDYNSSEVERYFDSLKFNKENHNNVLWDFFYELMITAILSRNFLLMGSIKKFISCQKFSIKYYYQEQHLKLYELMCLFHSYYLDDESLNKEEIRLSILESEFKYSYKEIIQLLLVVLNYHIDQNNSLILLNKFEEISKKLNYPLFSKDYLINYFT
jgi:hypothetical protein